MKDLNKTIFAENFILDILQGPKYAPEMNFMITFIKKIQGKIL